MAKWTPEEAAKLLAGRINQPHYVEAVIRKVLAEQNEAMQERLKLLTLPKEEGPPEIPPHLHGLADAIFTMTENGEDPSDMLAMLEAGMKKAYKATAQIGPKWDDEVTAEPASNYDDLRRQFLSLRSLANSKCRMAEHWRKQSDTATRETLLANAANVNAERDTNALLTDALEAAEAERDRLKAELEQVREYGAEFASLAERRNREIEALKAELERVRADAVRYRWLDSRKRWPSVHVDFNRDGRYRQHRICWYSGDGWSDATGQTLTEAIDAAMGKGGRSGD